MTIEQVRAQAIAKSDQNWAAAAVLLPEIERIADGGFLPTDGPLIRGMMHMLAGDLHIRAVQAIELETEPPAAQEPTHG